jgi:hypothetical protein
MLTSFKTAIGGAILIAMAQNGAYGQCLSQNVPLKDNYGDYVHYFLNRANVPGSQGYPMGELFFAVSQSGNRVQLGKYNGSCWTKIIGWVQKKYLIEGLRPLTVGQAAEQFPVLTQEPGVKPGSRLWLRALQKPEYYKEKPLTAPNPHKAAKKDIGLEGLAYRWRHVYAIDYAFDSVGEQLWYLVGSQSRLFHNPRTDTSTSQQVLLGWVPGKANQVLATNIALEFNTTKAAVDERIHQNKPVVLYREPRTNSQPLAKEALEVWEDYKRGRKTAGTMAWIEPEGIDPSYPRFYIHGFNPNTGWYHVSTWGGMDINMGFIDGYIPLKDQGRRYPSVQEVVVLEENELRTLRDNVHSIGDHIEKSFQPSALSGGILGALRKKVGSSNRREQMAATLLYAILATIGDQNTLNYLAQMDKVELLNLIRGWLRQNAENNIAAILGMQTSIETRSKGLLNRPLKEIVEMDPNTIRREARLLLNKSHCMGKILDSRTIPIEVEKCPNEQGVQKRWKYEQGNENYIYVPMRVIP